MTSPDLDPAPVLAYAADNASERLRRQCAGFWTVARISAAITVLAAWVSIFSWMITYNGGLVMVYAVASQCLGTLTYLVTSKLAIPRARRVQSAIVVSAIVLYVAMIMVLGVLVAATALFEGGGLVVTIVVVALVTTAVLGRAALTSDAPAPHVAPSEESLPPPGRDPDV